MLRLPADAWAIPELTGETGEPVIEMAPSAPAIAAQREAARDVGVQTLRAFSVGAGEREPTACAESQASFTPTLALFGGEKESGKK